MNIFPLPLFPEGSLSQSVITTVWVGIFVVTFFNQRLGWTFSGLVVPGYIVPLLIVKPWVAVIILLESFLTYFVAWFLFQYLPRWRIYAPLFGRDRFFMIVLVSVIVRVIFDGWLLHWIAIRIDEYFILEFDYHNNLQSFGLIIVALIANLFWKTGIVRGVPPLFINIAATFGLGALCFDGVDQF